MRLYDSKKDAARTSGSASTWQVPSSVHASRGKPNYPSDMPASVAFDGRSGASSPPSTTLLRKICRSPTRPTIRRRPLPLRPGQYRHGVGGIDEEASSFSNMIMFEKEEDSIGKEAFSSSYTILVHDRQGGLLVLVHDLVRGRGGLLLLEHYRVRGGEASAESTSPPTRRHSSRHERITNDIYM